MLLLRRPKPAILSRRALVALGFLGALASVACDKVPLTAPTGSTVTLFSNTTIVPVNGAAEITATVIEAGGTLVQNGTLVTFTTTIGQLDPGEARTRDGKVTVRLVAGTRSGRAIVRAFSGGVTSGDLSVDIGGAAAGSINLSANPSNVPASGGTSTLLAIVFDVDGNRLPGVAVSFTTTAGSLSSTVAVTNALGEATTTITTNRDADVTASTGGSG
ncbi:MAG: Ig-like domain-containing protein, partial [Vicinamibacteraceae bacterium]